MEVENDRKMMFYIGGSGGAPAPRTPPVYSAFGLVVNDREVVKNRCNVVVILDDGAGGALPPRTLPAGRPSAGGAARARVGFWAPQVSRVNDPEISQVLPHVASMEFEGCPTVEATYDDGKVCSEFATVCSLCAVAPAAAHRLMKCQFCG